jgi:uncharacterized membrane protein YeaQ/YmgE (transglycosylase-associated protein family)
MSSIIMFLVIGGIAGWAAGQIMRGGGFGIAGNIVVGIVGSIVGGLMLDVLGFHAGGFLARLITAVLGAVVLLYLVKLLRKA